ncbi:uncharacterized protein LOC111911156 [Lactuca sativa]|uniref:uncharacterized protein LOC111911156 n=1 Tax=Lactuca sativa TaxID=4236 RepID=UPI0022AEAD14|nr:uncharacterized protein LOC111911156 [Lactuca sativa]
MAAATTAVTAVWKIAGSYLGGGGGGGFVGGLFFYLLDFFGVLPSLLPIFAYYFQNLYMQIQVSRARKKYNVSYPALYATKGDTKDYKLFNCIQRGHQNSLESLTIFFVLMVLGGFKHPLIFSTLGLAHTVTRSFYFKGYSSGDPKGRLPIGYVNSSDKPLGFNVLEKAKINCDPN